MTVVYYIILCDKSRGNEPFKSHVTRVVRVIGEDCVPPRKELPSYMSFAYSVFVTPIIDIAVE